MKSNPQRLCIACRELKDKKELIRVVKDNEQFYLDMSGKRNGRGAYICANTDCIAQARKTNALSKSFKCKVDKTFYDELINYEQN